VGVDEFLFPLGFLAGLLIGFLAWGLHLKSTHRKLAELNTQIISLSLDRRRLAQDLDETLKTLDETREALKHQNASTHNRSNQLVVMIEQNHQGDLERVKGIGPKTAMLLAAEGIVDLASLVNLDDESLAEIAKRRPLIAERLLREQWREQAASVLAQLVD
jgi:predicted flap endonuclease-1-like 5' DNA nuclease